MSKLEAWAPDGMPEVEAGDDLAALVLAALGGGADLADGDVVSVTSKVVSKAEGRTRAGDREAAIDEETVRVVARRGATRIVRHRLGPDHGRRRRRRLQRRGGLDRPAPPRPGRLGPRPAPRDPASGPGSTSA